MAFFSATSSALTPSGCLTPSLPAWPLQALECVTIYLPGKVPCLGATVTDLEPPREEGMTGRMRLREKRRNPGILEVFLSLHKIASIGNAKTSMRLKGVPEVTFYSLLVAILQKLVQ